MIIQIKTMPKQIWTSL